MKVCKIFMIQTKVIMNINFIINTIIIKVTIHKINNTNINDTDDTWNKDEFTEIYAKTKDGRRVQAIKDIMAFTELDLKESKDIVDNWRLYDDNAKNAFAALDENSDKQLIKDEIKLLRN